MLGGPIKGDWREVCAEHVLVPELFPGEFVNMDISKQLTWRREGGIEAVGANSPFLLFCPDFTPIEKNFS